MIISLQLKNFYSLRDEVALDFTADFSSRKSSYELTENLIDFSGDKFVNLIGLFGSNAAGKSNVIKAIAYCRNLILTSHLNNGGDELDYEPFKFAAGTPSEFHINFVTQGVEYEYSFALHNGEIVSEELYHYPKKRKSKIFTRTGPNIYSFKKGMIARPSEIQLNTGSKTLFLSRASSMNREIAQTVYRFFLNQMVIGLDSIDLQKISAESFRNHKSILLKGLEVGDSDIVDIRLEEKRPGQLHLVSYHKENPDIPFDFVTEESEGTKRLMVLLMIILEKTSWNATFFIDEFDLKLHLRLAEFILDLIRASRQTQMVFTSHNPCLINEKTLRKEQIVFVNKQADGNSEIYPLSDFIDVDKQMDLQKAYLLGRFDAVPYIGDAINVVNEQIDRPE